MLEIASNGVNGKSRGCMWWYILCGLVLGTILFWAMKWSVEYGEEMYGKIESSPKKQVVKNK